MHYQGEGHEEEQAMREETGGKKGKGGGEGSDERKQWIIKKARKLKTDDSINTFEKGEQ